MNIETIGVFLNTFFISLVGIGIICFFFYLVIRQREEREWGAIMEFFTKFRRVQ